MKTRLLTGLLCGAALLSVIVCMMSSLHVSRTLQMASPKAAMGMWRCLSFLATHPSAGLLPRWFSMRLRSFL